MLSFNFSPFPDLSTERLLLSMITTGDAQAVFALRSNAAVMQFIDRPLAKTIDDALALIKVLTDALEKNDGITWAIRLKDDPTLVGTIGFWRIQKEDHRAEIGYLLHPAQQGKGLMQEAISAVLGYGFVAMHLHSVEANVNPANTASIRLLERNGFVREAYFRENYYSNGKFVDSAIYSLLARESSLQK